MSGKKFIVTIGRIPSFLTTPRSLTPPTDMFETEEEFIVVVDVGGGVNAEEIGITFERSTLKISGTKASPYSQTRPLRIHQLQIEYGEFACDIFIPSPVDRESTRAIYEDGFLKVFMPKLKKKSRRIKIE